MVNYLRAFHYFRSLLERSYWPLEKLERYQNQGLRNIVAYAYENVPFYRRKFKRAGLKPDEIRSVVDLWKLPMTSKEEIRANLREAVSTRYTVSNLELHRTSGSTGQPLNFYISRQEDEYRKARHLRANSACGQRLRDKYVTITHPLYFSQTSRIQRFLGFYAPIPISVFDDVDKQITALAKLRPDIVDGYASSLLLLAKRIEEEGVKTINPRFLISGADLIDPHSRKFVEEVFDAPFYDQYACAEFERMAWQCEERSGYHIDADSLLMEFVDAQDENVGKDESGEIVCTSLFNHAMPLIRYRVGDIGKTSEEDACQCGRTFPLMKIMEGRKDASITLPDGRVISSFAFIAGMYRLSFYDKISQFRVVQKKSGLFTFLIKMRQDGPDEKSAQEELARLFSQALGISQGQAKFEVSFTGEIPLEKSGKFRAVVSEVASSVGH